MVRFHNLRSNPTWESATRLGPRPLVSWQLGGMDMKGLDVPLFQIPSISNHYDHSYFLFSVHHTHSLTFLIKNITNLYNHCRSPPTLPRRHPHLQYFISATYQHINTSPSYPTANPHLHQPTPPPPNIHSQKRKKMQLQSILILLALTSTPILALPIVPEHSTLGAQSIELHNIHQESCLQLSQSIEAVVAQLESESCDQECKTKSNKTLEILRSARKEFPCQA